MNISVSAVPFFACFAVPSFCCGPSPQPQFVLHSCNPCPQVPGFGSQMDDMKVAPPSWELKSEQCSSCAASGALLVSRCPACATFVLICAECGAVYALEGKKAGAEIGNAQSSTRCSCCDGGLHRDFVPATADEAQALGFGTALGLHETARLNPEWNVVAALCGSVAGAALGLVAGWFVPGICLAVYFRHFDQAGLLLLYTAPVGAVIGAVAGLRFRKWWAGGIAAIIGLGPATVLLILGRIIPALLVPVICAFGAYFLQAYFKRRTQNRVG